MSRYFVNQLTPGSKVNEVFLLCSTQLKDYAKGRFLSLELGDRTGQIGAVMWDGAEQAYQRIEVGDLVRVKGWVGSYNNKPQVTVDSIDKVASENMSDWSDFLPETSKDKETMLAGIREIINSIKTPYLNKLLRLFFEDAHFLKQFKEIPAAKKWHHSYRGGLLEHTLTVVILCDRIADLYPLDKDILLAGAILHDIGKIEEFSTGAVTDYSDEGRLIGHTILGDEMVRGKIDQIPDFPSEPALRLRHMLISHHGEYEFQAPKKPKTPEACLLHFADNLDAHVTGFLQEIDKARADGRSWTDYVKVVERYLYVGSKKKDLR
ncbi:MAG: HD domain-containing protein [bacterium]